MSIIDARSDQPSTNAGKETTRDNKYVYTCIIRICNVPEVVVYHDVGVARLVCEAEIEAVSRGSDDRRVQ